MQLIKILDNTPVIPIIVIDNAAHAVDLAKALQAGGINVLEITLRTPAALDAIKAIKQALPDCIVGAGTIVNEEDLDAVKKAGAEFAVCPGISSDLIKKAETINLPFLPGVATGSEITLALQHNLKVVKLFPASLVGGVNAIKSFASVFPGLKFCPTGGINAQNYQDYLALDNVVCVGGSWLAPKDLIAKQDWAAITELAQAIR